MVHGLAQPLGGGIRIFSKLGLGTNVELWLPEAAGSPLQPLTIRRGGPSSPIHRGKTLLVDDEEVVRIHTAHMLDDKPLHLLKLVCLSALAFFCYGLRVVCCYVLHVWRDKLRLEGPAQDIGPPL